MSSVVINGTLLLDSNLSCNGDIEITSHGKVIPVPDEDIMKTFYSYHTNSYKTANGGSRSMTSTTSNIIVEGVISGIGRGFESNRGPGCNSLFVDEDGDVLSGYGASHAGLGSISTAWDNTDCIFALAPAAWANGNAPADFNTGVMPSYPAGAYQPCTLTNMAVGYGFVNPDLKFDGNNDYIQCNDVLECNSVSKLSIEFIMNQDVIDVTDFIFRKRIDGNNDITVFTHGNGNFYFTTRNAGDQYGYFDYSTKIIAGIDAHIVMVFDGTLSGNANRLKVFVNDEQIALTFNGTIPATTANLLGFDAELGATGSSFGGKIKWFAIYSDALTPSRISTNYSLGTDMRLVGNNVGTNMNLEKPSFLPSFLPSSNTYGNYETPVSLGSGSGYYHNPADLFGEETRGGGAIRLNARSGVVTLNGPVNMNGMDGTHAGGASGGSIWISAWKIDGTGLITAEGGTTLLSNNAGGGSGGYISLWHDHTLNFDGTMSVCGKTGAEDGKIFIKEIEPILEERFTGPIWNTKWWDHTNSVTIDNDLTLSSPNDIYDSPIVNSLFNVSGKEIMTTLDYAPKGPDTTQYNASFVLYVDDRNWIGLAKRQPGIFGISSVDGIVSASGIPFDNTNVTLRLVKNDGTFLFQYYDATSAPQTIYTDVRQELANETFSIRMSLDKPSLSETFHTDCLRLTPLDISRQYIDLDGTASDQSAVALNVIKGTSQYYGLDFYAEGDKVKWDSTGLSAFHTPFTLVIIDYFILSERDILSRSVELSEVPVIPEVAVNAIRGTTQYYGADFTVIDRRVEWAGRGLESLLAVGDELRITYYFDPWNINLFGDLVSWGDIVRVQYQWDAPASNPLEMIFDNFKIFDGIMSHAETKEPVIYVDPDYGSDSSSGRQLEPLKNLFVATAWAKKGGTVVLYDGTHNPTAVSRKDLTLRGAEGVQSFITTEFVQDTTGSGWENTGLSLYGCQGLAENIDFTSCRNAIIVENGSYDIIRNTICDTSNAVKFIKCDPVIARNKIRNTGRALDFTSCLPPYIYSNVVADASVALVCGHTPDTTVSSNTFDNNQTHVVLDNSSSATIASNSLTYSVYGIQASLDSSTLSYHNNFYAVAQKYNRTLEDTSGDFTANPLYYNRAHRDYHINAGSPNIGRGLLTYDDYLIDYDGANRLHVDIGAFQYIDGTHSGDYYVTSHGDDHWNFGGQDDPFRTLDKAMAVADSTVYIDGGHYDSFYLNLRSQNIDLNQLYIYTGSIQHFVSYLTLTSEDITHGYIALPTFVEPDDSSHVALNILGGATQKYDVDYKVEYGHLLWKGYVLENFLAMGDILRILFYGPLQRKALNTLILHNHYSDYAQEKAIFASPSGSDSTVLSGDGTNTGGDGSIDLPYRTISRALSQSSSGDNIVAMAGEYPIFNGLDNRTIVPAFDRTSVPDKTPRRCFEDFFAPEDFRAYGTTRYDSVPWDFDYAGNSFVFSGGGFLNFTYDGTNTASADSTFEFMGDFKVMADLRNAVDPIKLMVTSPDNTACFSYNDPYYYATVVTGDRTTVCSGLLEDRDTTGENNYITEYISLSGDNIRNKYVPLRYIPETSDSSNVALNIGGIPQNYGEDFYVEDSKIKWDNRDLDGEMEAGEVIRVIYLDRTLSPLVTALISFESGRFTIKAFDNTWKTVMIRDMIGSYHGSWKISFLMDEPTPSENHAYVYGKGFVSKFLAVAESFIDLNMDKSFDVRTERRNLVLYNERLP